MNHTKLKERFLSFTKHDLISLVSMGLALLLGLYMSIGMSVSIAKGHTLFGDSNNHENVMESAVTKSDYIVLALFWTLTVLVLVLFVYYLFFKKQAKKKIVKKEIVNGKTVIVKEDNDESK